MRNRDKPPEWREGPRNMAEAYIAYERYITEEWAPLLRELLRAKRDAILKDKDKGTMSVTLERVKELRSKLDRDCIKFDEMVGSTMLDRCYELDAILDLAERSLTGSGEQEQPHDGSILDSISRDIAALKSDTPSASDIGYAVAHMKEALTVMRVQASTIALFERDYDAKDARISLLEEALRPFAALLNRKTSYGADHFGPWNSDSERAVVGVAVGDLRRAASILDETGE